MQRRAAGIIFTIHNSNETNIATNNSNTDNNKEKAKTHIMISYNCGSRELCLRLNKELKVNEFDFV